MIKEPCLPLFDLAVCVSDAADLVCPKIVNHHKQVAYLAYCIGAEFGLDEESQKDLVLAGAMHDIGALSLTERLETLTFETTNPSLHAEIGYSLLQQFAPLSRVSRIVRHHHHDWHQGQGNEADGEAVFIESNIIYVADRVAVLMNPEQEILGQAGDIETKILELSGSRFRPEVVEAFRSIAQREYFWLDAVSPTIYRTLRRKSRMRTLTLDLPQLLDLAQLFSRIIDFRSRFTATHSAGVAATAESLASLSRFSKREQQYMHIAGLLHDLGKLAIPREILEKPGKLEKKEFDLVRSHTYHTFRILDTLEDFETINEWASFHHERLKGNGYPFHHTGDVLSLGSRIMCVADVFTAILEDRPYRPGMTAENAKSVLTTMANHEAIDADIVELLLKNFDYINSTRKVAQTESQRMYKEIMYRHCE